MNWPEAFCAVGITWAVVGIRYIVYLNNKIIAEHKE